jgi:UDP-3-O-[3-hydroxymyristoyl] N-acetylglucosamine deacetylase
MFLQRTIRQSVVVKGIGIHSGQSCTLKFSPAPADTGIYFVRADLKSRPFIKVSADHVMATTYQTQIGNEHFQVATIEHCISALSALRIDNLFIELDGPEIPICDGSAKEFLSAILSVGFFDQDQPRRYCYIKEPIFFEEGDKHAYVLPYMGLRLTVTIDFPHPCIGKQKLDIDINETTFEKEIAPARTFGFLKDIEMMKSKGLALGGSLNNAIVLTEDTIMNPEGLRFPDEFVRHKMLDALGDLVTLNMPLMGHVVLYKAGHDLMNKLVRKIQASYKSIKVVELGADISEEVARYSSWSLPELDKSNS